MFATSAFSFLLSCLRLARFVFLGRRPQDCAVLTRDSLRGGLVDGGTASLPTTLPKP